MPWSERSDFGGTTEWSIKGLASQLSLGKLKVGKAVDALLNAGFLTVLAFVPSGNGSKKRLFRVTHYSQLENVRHALSLITDPFGLSTSPVPGREVEEDCFSDGVFTEDQEDWFDFLATDYDPEFNGLHEGDYIANFNERKDLYKESKFYKQKV
ncbi:hypothetical protein SynMVIR181_00611 [Synechococcus sp. MVIR-18-1]|nr:hypothetical protein SynMVIR181_00611 [Synechococcus sp. MVIR-18-1]